MVVVPALAEHAARSDDCPSRVRHVRRRARSGCGSHRPHPTAARAARQLLVGSVDHHAERCRLADRGPLHDRRGIER
jgi:hypothetical protein